MKSLEVVPRSARAQALLADCHDSIGDIQAAIDAAGAALEIEPSHIGALTVLLVIHIRRRDMMRLGNVTRELLVLTPDSAIPHGALAYMAIIRRDGDAAREHIDTALRLNPHYEFGRIMHAELKLDIEGPEAADETLHELARDYPLDSCVHYLLGEQALLRDDLQTATQCFGHALALDPENKRAQLRVLSCQLRNTAIGRLTNAMQSTLNAPRKSVEEVGYWPFLILIPAAFAVLIHLALVIECLWLAASAELWLVRRAPNLPARLKWQFLVVPLPAILVFSLFVRAAQSSSETWMREPVGYVVFALLSLWTLQPTRRLLMWCPRPVAKRFAGHLVLLALMIGTGLFTILSDLATCGVFVFVMILVELDMMRTCNYAAGEKRAHQSMVPCLTLGPIM